MLEALQCVYTHTGKSAALPLFQCCSSAVASPIAIYKPLLLAFRLDCIESVPFPIIMQNTAFSLDAKTDRFTQYLDRSTAADLISKALVALYEEPQKPEDPISFIRSFLGGAMLQDVAATQREVAELRERNEKLEKLLEEMRRDVEAGRKRKRTNSARRGKK